MFRFLKLRQELASLGVKEVVTRASLLVGDLICRHRSTMPALVPHKSVGEVIQKSYQEPQGICCLEERRCRIGKLLISGSRGSASTMFRHALQLRVGVHWLYPES